MKLGIMQPYFLPYIGYWQLNACVDKLLFMMDSDLYQRRMINRNRYLYQGEAKYCQYYYGWRPVPIKRLMR